MTSQLLRVSAAAKVLDCSAGHVYDLIAAGQLRAVDIAGAGTRSKTRVREEDLQTYIDSKTRTAPPRAS